MKLNDISVPLVEVRRGDIVESRHRGFIAAATSAGKTVAGLGTLSVETYLRSSAKPFQAIPLITSGAADRFRLTGEEIALACASHNGEPLHVGIVRGMLRKIGLGPEALKCGIHEPFSRQVVEELRRNNELPNVLQNNCSGKHAGMLALALHLGAPTESYDELKNPVQQAIIGTVSEISGLNKEQLHIGIDGCGVPVFGMPLGAMALMYARLVAPPADMKQPLREACRRIVTSMVSFPEVVGGTSERLDTLMMRGANKALISKIGAEGVYTVGVLPSEKWPDGLGLALKIEDGEDRRARPTVVIEALRQFGVLDDNLLEALGPYRAFDIRNHRGDLVGQVRPDFQLEMF